MKKSTMRVLSLVMALMMIVGTLAVVPFSAAEEKHTHTKGTLVEKVAPTCTLYGYSIYKCADAECGEAFLADVVEKLEHVPEEVGEVPATCDEDGHSAGILCANCGEAVPGYVAPEIYPARHTLAYKLADSGNCEEGIRFITYCKVCNKNLTADDVIDGQKFIDDEIAGKAGAEAHKYEIEVTEAPTCTTYGVATVSCSACDFVLENVAIEKVEHTWKKKTKAATFAEVSKTYEECEVCGEIKKDAKGKEIYTDVAGSKTHAELMGINLDAEIAKLKVGETYTQKDRYSDEVYSYTKKCKEKWAKVYAFDVEETINNQKKVVTYRSDSKKAIAGETNLIELTKDQSTDKLFANNSEFIAFYANYCDVADLYILSECTEDKCGATKKEVVLKKVGHQYDAEYTFEFRAEDLLSDEDDKPIINIGGQDTKVFSIQGYEGVEEFYACETIPYRTGKCVICGTPLGKLDSGIYKDYLGGAEQQHYFVSLCLDEDCEEEFDENDENALVVPLYDTVNHVIVDPKDGTVGGDIVQLNICKNPQHAQFNVCFNKDTSKPSGYCYAFDIERDEETGDPVLVQGNPVVINVPKVCDHEYDDDAEPEVVPATCVALAYKARVCVKCGHLEKIENSDFGEKDPTNHDFDSKDESKHKVLDAATCQTGGRRIDYCANFGCDKYRTVDTEIDTENGHQLVLLDTELATCANALQYKYYCKLCDKIIYVTPEYLDEQETVKNEKLDAFAINATDGKFVNHNIKAVDAKAAECLKDGTVAYEYCKDCGIVISIDGRYSLKDAIDAEKDPQTSEIDYEAVEVHYVDDEDFADLVAAEKRTIFTPKEWKVANGGDEKVVGEAVYFANGEVMFFRLTSAGVAHRMTGNPEVPATCLKSGTKAKYYCQKCDFVNKEFNGAVIPALNHSEGGVIEAPEDETLIKKGYTRWLVPADGQGDNDALIISLWALRGTVYATMGADGPVDAKGNPIVKDDDDQTFKDGNGEAFKDRIIPVPANDVITYTVSNNIPVGAVIYQYRYVEATCEADGYIIGQYCTLCMKTIKEDGEDVPFEYYTDNGDYTLIDKDGNIVYELDANDEPTDVEVKQPKVNDAGYKLEKKVHSFATLNNATHDRACGADGYYCKLQYCQNCKSRTYSVNTYRVIGYEKPQFVNGHKFDAYTKAEAETLNDGTAAGDPKPYYAIIDKDGNIVEVTVENAKKGIYKDANNKEYYECSTVIYTAKKCVNELKDDNNNKAACGKLYDLEPMTQYGHYVSWTDKEGTAFKVDCENFAANAGATCDCCGLTVPKVEVVDVLNDSKKDSGLDEEKYYTMNLVPLDMTKDTNKKKYFTVEHDFALDPDDCEALNAEILTCAVCGIKIVNEDKDNKYCHEYYLLDETVDKATNKTVNATSVKAGKFNVDNYENYAFTNVVYPTATAEGLGTLKCLICGKEEQVVIPVVGVEASVKLDSRDIAIVGDVVTATLRINAKDFAFNTIKLKVTNNNSNKRIKLVDVKLEYEFAAIDAVTATLNAAGNEITITTPGIANKNVTISGENKAFLTLYFKTGDLTNASEETTLGNITVEAIDDSYRYDYNKTTKEYEAKDIKTDFAFGENDVLTGTKVYNPAYTNNTIGVLGQIYSVKYTTKYDFNDDGDVDLDDYFALVDFQQSKKTIADFCTLTGYDVEAMLDSLKYDAAIAAQRNKISVDPDGTMHITPVTEDSLKAAVRSSLASSNYTATIIGGGITIDEFAQNIINAYNPAP